VPQAIAEAFRSGNLGVMDYYKMKNIQADSDMRGAISSNVGAAADNGSPPAQVAPAPVKAP
jgi:uncharacterized protein YqfA (UPF0365 family)